MQEKNVLQQLLQQGNTITVHYMLNESNIVVLEDVKLISIEPFTETMNFIVVQKSGHHMILHLECCAIIDVIKVKRNNKQSKGCDDISIG